jgi:uncharacterized coiled-coil protein SlyX
MPTAGRFNFKQVYTERGSPRLVVLVLVMLSRLCVEGQLLAIAPPLRSTPCHYSEMGIANASRAASISQMLASAEQYEYFRSLERRARISFHSAASPMPLRRLLVDEPLEATPQVGGAEQYVGAVQFVARMQAQLVDLQQAVVELKSESAFNRKWLELNAQHTAQLELKIAEFKAQVEEVSARVAEVSAQVAEVSARVRMVWDRTHGSGAQCEAESWGNTNLTG